MGKKLSVDHLEYKGGYALVGEAEIVTLLEAYQRGGIRKDHLRVWAARHEQSALHGKSKVTLERILNCKAAEAGLKRLRSGVIQAAGKTLDYELGKPTVGSHRRRAIARPVLRAMAQGRLTCTECLVCLMYALRRIRQRKSLRRLLPNERYARFTYGELQELCGVAKANLSRAVALLREKGLLSTVWVVKQNENQFGLLFVDGPLLSLIPGSAAQRNQPAARKTTTPPAQNANTPVIILPTLRKDYPKREIQKGKGYSLPPVKTVPSDFERIKARARAIVANLMEQAA